MRQVFQPLEVRNRHAAGIEEHVGDDDFTSFQKHFLAAGSDGAIGCFRNDFGLDIGSVFIRDDVFQCSGYQNVAIVFQDGFALLFRDRNRAGIVEDGTGFFAELQYIIDVKSVFVVNSAFHFAYAHDDGAAFILRNGAGEGAYIAETLNDEALAFQAGSHVQTLHVFRYVAGFADTVIYPAAGSFAASVDAVLRDGFTCDNARCVYIGAFKSAVGVVNPCHFAFAGAVVGGGNVNRWADEVAAHQFGGVAASDALQHFRGVVPGVDFYTAFCATEGHVHNGAFVSHQSGEGHYFFLVDMVGVANPPFGRRTVVAVLYAVCFDHFYLSVLHFYRKEHAVNGVANADLFQ